MGGGMLLPFIEYCYLLNNFIVECWEVFETPMFTFLYNFHFSESYKGLEVYVDLAWSRLLEFRINCGFATTT